MKGLFMKKVLLVCILSSSLTTIISVEQNLKLGSAQPPAAVAEVLKIRYVEPYIIIPKLEQWNDERLKIQKELENRTKQIEDLKTAYTTKATELQSKGNILSEIGKTNAIKELNRLETDIKFEQQSFQETAERTSQEAQKAIFREIETAAKEYAQKNGIDFVFAGGAIYVNDNYDISDMIADIMNKKYVEQKAKTAPKGPEPKK